MLRKMRVDGPADRLNDLVEAARHAGLELDDWAIDSSDEYGWPSRGDGNAYILAVVDDDARSIDDVVTALRAAHAAGTGADSRWIVAAGSFVYLPDGMEPEWYDDVAPWAEALHDAERDGDATRAASLRATLVARVGEVSALADSRFAAFATFVADF